MSAAAIILALAAEAMAEAPQIPPFLDGTAVFSRSAELCPGGEPSEIEGYLHVNKSGLYGYELGCTFLQFLPERDPESKDIYGWLVIAQCGDDSGITRPDMFSLHYNESGPSLTVQSQNEYVASSVLLLTGQDTGEDPYLDPNFLSGEYRLCPAR